MTRPYSDATLDALAATRSTRSLPDAIELHQSLWAADLSGARRLHDRTGEPEGTDSRKVKPRTNKPGLIGTTGMPFSHTFKRFLDAEYGLIYPWRNGLLAMRENHCRRTHREHQGRTEWRGSLCYQLVTFTVVRKLSLWNACEILGVTPARNEPVLLTALGYIEDEIDRQRKRAEKRSKPHPIIPDWREPKRIHHAVDGLHVEDCRQCRRTVDPSARVAGN